MVNISQGGKKNMKKIKKIIFSFVLCFCFVFSLFTLAACKDKKTKPSVATNNIFTMGMVSASNYLENNYKTKNAVVPDSTKETLKEYTLMFEELLQNGIHPTEGVPTEEENTKYGTYAKKLSLNVDGQTYSMFYNEVFEGTETEIDDQKIETETTTFLYGKVVKTVGNEDFVYNVVGSREIESEQKRNKTEVESEIELVFSTSELAVKNTKSFENINLSEIDEYVLIEQESEENEIEFEYTTKSGSNLKTVEIEFENKLGKEKLEIEIEESGSKVEYEISKVNATKYLIKLKSNKSKTVFYLENNSGVWSFIDKDGNAF